MTFRITIFKTKEKNMDGDRRKTRYGGKTPNNTKYPLRSRLKTYSGTIVIKPKEVRDEPYRKKPWDLRGMPRPSWLEPDPNDEEDDTVDTVLSVLNEKTVSREGKHGTKYQCPACKGYFYRKRVLEAVYGDVPSGKTFITIDHTLPGGYKDIIWKTAEADSDGHISMESAKMAYNNPKYLAPLCGICNSAKNAKKNVYV